jgi:hypothetical protein
MTITPITTRQGKTIHTLAADDLVDAVEHGERIRAFCPIHGGDHQRSLSIDVATGFGFCHCCHATVLVKEIGCSHSSELRQWHSYAHPHMHAEVLSPPSFADDSRTSFVQPYAAVQRASPGATILPAWQQAEVSALKAITPLVREGLVSSRRVQTYLEERCIPIDVAMEDGVGYLTRANWDRLTLPDEQRALLKRWIGRIIFPLSGPDGQGFIGRTLVRWARGMDENMHKALLDRPGAPRRWIKTNPAGWFGFAQPERLASAVVLVEGGFDRLALRSAGLPDNAVLALVGTAARANRLVQMAPQVQQVILALDADTGGLSAMQHLTDEFQRVGLAVRFCPPPSDSWGKDWNERFRRLGPQSVWPLFEVLADAIPPLHVHP